jgi:uncharacterized repeat protein (TIGR01451 family)
MGAQQTKRLTQNELAAPQFRQGSNPPTTANRRRSVLQRIAFAIFAVTLTSAATLAADSVYAKSEAGVKGTLTQNKVVVAADGKESLASAEKVKPGDVVEYQARYINEGATPVTNLIVTLPIPKGLELIAKTDLPPGALASVDSVKFEPTPLKRMVRRADGTQVAELIPLNEYRALRWQVAQLAAGKSAVFVARAKVDNGATTSAVPVNK